MSRKNKRELKVTINPENATEQEVIWETEDEKIVKVDENGEITGVSNGETNIIARVGEKEAKCKVKVITTATGIKLDKQKVTLDITTNKQMQITAKAVPQTATNSKITWTSEDIKIARVTSKGLITGISNGKTKIIAKIGTITKECEVTVETSPDKIKLNKKNIELDLNQNNQTKIEAKIVPNTSSYTKINWSTSNKKVAIVDQTGKVTAKGVGVATITAKIDGQTKVKAKANVEVNSNVSDIELSKKNINLNLRTSATSQITAKIKNGETYKEATWKSSNKSVAKVEGNGLKATIKAVGIGTATITIKIDGKSENCKVVVENNIDVNKIELDQTNIILFKNVTDTINAKIFPTNATNKKLTYSISNPDVVNVMINTNGVIKVVGKNPGNSIIIIKSTDGSNIISKINVNVLNGDSNTFYKYKSTVYRIVKSRINLNEFINILGEYDLLQFGRVSYPDKCLSFAEAYSFFLAERTAEDFANVDKDDLANYKFGYFKSYNNDNKKLVLQKMYDEITRGYAPVLHVNGNGAGTSRHYITVVGCAANTPRSKLQESDFLIIDCARNSFSKDIK